MLTIENVEDLFAPLFVLLFGDKEIVVGGMSPQQQEDLEVEIVGIQYSDYVSERPEPTVSWVQY